MNPTAALRSALAPLLPAGVRLEVEDCPGVPPTPGAASVRFADAGELAAALEAFDLNAVGNGEAVRVYLKRSARTVPTPDGAGFDSVAVFVADFARPERQA